MTEPNVGGYSTRMHVLEMQRLNPAALEADLMLRLERLEHLVAGLGVALQRLQAGGTEFGATASVDFDDSEASNEALDVLFASTAGAHRDLIALRRDGSYLLRGSD